MAIHHPTPPLGGGERPRLPSTHVGPVTQAIRAMRAPTWHLHGVRQLDDLAGGGAPSWRRHPRPLGKALAGSSSGRGGQRPIPNANTVYLTCGRANAKRFRITETVSVSPSLSASTPAFDAEGRAVGGRGGSARAGTMYVLLPSRHVQRLVKILDTPTACYSKKHPRPPFSLVGARSIGTSVEVERRPDA